MEHERINPDQRLVVATHNRGKLLEIADLLDGLGYSPVSIAEMDPALGPPEEIHQTFEENALLKARAGYQATACLTLADDSGLEVDALDGRPGVHSARYAGEGASSAEMVAKLLAELREIPSEQRQARFVCVVAIVGKGIERTFTGSCDGLISRAPQGTEGFGYDPVFLEPISGRTFGEMTGAEKSGHSHRGRALSQVRTFLEQLRTEKH